MPAITSGSNATITVAAGQLLTVQCDTGSEFIYESPVGTRIGQYGSDRTFGPYTAAGSVKVTSVIGALSYSIEGSVSLAGDTNYDPSNVAITAGVIGGVLWPNVAGDGSGDDASAINAALATASAAGGGRVVVGRGSTGVVLVGSALIVPSNTTLELVAGVTLRRKTGYAGNLIQNKAVQSGGRDANVGLEMGAGALIDGGNNSSGSGSNLHHILFRYVDGLKLPSYGYYTTTGGKYALAIQDCTAIVGGVQRFGTSSDGLHFTGPISNAYIAGLTGTTGDDMLALTPQDWSAYDVTNGTISGVRVGYIDGSTSAALLKIIGSKVAGQKVRDIEIGPITGSSSNALWGIAILNFDQSPYGDLDLDNVRIGVVSMTLSAASTVAYVAGASIKGLTFAGFHMGFTGTETGALRVTSVSGTAPSIDHLRIGRLTASATAPANANLINISSGTTVNQLTIGDLDLVLQDNNSRAVLVTGTVTDLNLPALRVQGSSAGVGIAVATTTPGVLTRLNVGNARLTSARRLFINYSGAAATHVQADHVIAKDCSRLVENVSGSGAITYNQAGGKFDGFLSAPFYANGGALVVNMGGAFTKSGATANLQRAGSESVRYTSENQDAGVDVSILTPSDGDITYNTNSGLGCGAGAVVYNTTAGKWKNLYSGLTT